MNSIILALSLIVVAAGYLVKASPVSKEHSPVFYNPHRFKRFGQDKNSGSDVFQSLLKKKPTAGDSHDGRQARAVPAEVPERVARQIYPAEEDDESLQRRKRSSDDNENDKGIFGSIYDCMKLAWNAAFGTKSFLSNLWG